MLWVHGIYVVLYKSYLRTVCTVQCTHTRCFVCLYSCLILNHLIKAFRANLFWYCTICSITLSRQYCPFHESRRVTPVYIQRFFLYALLHCYYSSDMSKNQLSWKAMHLRFLVLKHQNWFIFNTAHFTIHTVFEHVKVEF